MKKNAEIKQRRVKDDLGCVMKKHEAKQNGGWQKGYCDRYFYLFGSIFYKTCPYVKLKLH